MATSVALAAVWTVAMTMMLGHAAAEVDPAPVRTFAPSIGWSTVDGGGDTAKGGVFTIDGTAGQPDSEFATGGGVLDLSGGFWALGATPEAEPLIFADDFETGDLTKWSASAP